LIFQTLDDKKECVGIYLDGELCFNQALPSGLSKTWSYSAFLENLDIQYASIYCEGKSLREACPEALKDRLEAAEKKYMSFIKSFTTSRVSLNENCFYDLVPKKFLLEWCYIQDMICEHVFETYERPKNYDYTLELIKVIEEIKHNKLNIDKKELKLYKVKHMKFLKSLKSMDPYCRFNVWGTKTGRLTTIKNSFPILTLDKEFRSIVKPKNDFFVELDFNAAELRTLLSLLGKKQPQEDMHAWNVENIFKGNISRDDAKKRIFAWLYNPESKDRLCEKFYDRETIINKYYDGTKVTTPFGKEIESQERTALNYIIQSTCAENVLKQMIKVSNYLKGTKSHVAFPIHDSIVLDLSVEDKERLPELLEIFSQTDLGKFKVNVSVGTNFGNLKKLEV